jgi:uncharacterized protein YggU (UPF0235/DUF167 family)
MKPKLGNGDSITRIAVKVSAGTARNAIRGWQDQCLRVHLVTAPERGKANAALIALLAQALGLPKSAISIIRGEHSARKTLAVSGLSEVDVVARLDPKSPSK